MLNVLVLSGRSYDGEPVELEFPLRGGTYAVMQGGGNRWTKLFHAPSASERYAVDLVKLNALGNRATGLAPVDPDAYAIFGEPIHSPCSGRVVEVRDGLPDRPARRPDPENPPGNHVIVRCLGVRVLLAHMKSGSVAVRAGDPVETGQLLGSVGNSGNTIEPHLHISAARASARSPEPVAVPMLFDGRFLVLNGTVKAGRLQRNVAAAAPRWLNAARR